MSETKLCILCLKLNARKFIMKFYSLFFDLSANLLCPGQIQYILIAEAHRILLDWIAEVCHSFDCKRYETCNFILMRLNFQFIPNRN